MLLITETAMDLLENEIVESEGKKSFYIKGIFAQSDVKNRNGRVYPSNILREQVNKFSQNKIANKTSLGELNHPQGPTINLDRASHLIESLDIEENNVMGKAKILSTACGQTARQLMEDGVTLGVSTRGLGTVKYDRKWDANVVNEDFHLATIDIVADPSAPDAFVQGIMEGVEYYFDNDLIIAKPLIERHVDSVQNAINEAVRSKVLDEEKIKIFESFIKKLGTL